LTEELLDRLVAQSDAQAGGRSIRELERLRDDCLVSVLAALRANDTGAGAVLRTWERRLAVDAPAPGRQAPLELYDTVVRPEWVDYNGHMTESRYLQAFGDTSHALLRQIGATGDYLKRGSYFTVETHLSHLNEARSGEQLHATTQLLGHDPKRLHVFHSLQRTQDGEVLATAEQMLLHVDMASRRAAPAPPEILERVALIAAAHEQLPVPAHAGRRIELPQ
jgi:carnitine 3-dehydrogenase